jgi:hypothetical protein
MTAIMHIRNVGKNSRSLNRDFSRSARDFLRLVRRVSFNRIAINEPVENKKPEPNGRNRWVFGSRYSRWCRQS